MKDCFYKYATETVVLHNFMSALEQGCSRCTLAAYGHKPIVFRGNPESDIMLVGEAPGKVEQLERSPFVGPAGQLLDNMMKSIGLSTEDDMFITNAVYCRPTAPKGSGKQNYTPKDVQVERCTPFTEALIKNVIKPKIIIACGRIALQQLTGDKNIKIGQYEGKWIETHGTPTFVMIHPAALLYLGDKTEAQSKKKRQVWLYLQEFRDSWKEKINGNSS